ncbi:AAA family ATPase [Thermodesulfobacteriota bacterium]
MNRSNQKSISPKHAHSPVPGSYQDRVYLDFYHLKEAPFSITPDPEFLFFSTTHQSVLDKIQYGVNNRMGFILLAGEVGTGKTTICRSILDRFENSAEMVYIINPSLSGRELISSILDDLGVDYAPGSSKKDLIDHLNRFALSATKTKPVMIIIDDAQTMPLGALEDLRLLSNLETDKEKLLQMVLVGQPELIEIISRPEIRQLRQRVVISCHLDFLTPREVEGYIARRLFVAGDKGQIRFTRKAKQQIAKASSGIPRLINKICDYALTSGYIANDFTIGPEHVDRALMELGELDFKTDPLKIRQTDRRPETDRRWIRYPVYGFISILIIILLSVHLLDLNISKNENNTGLGLGPGTLFPENKEVLLPEPNNSVPQEIHQTLNKPRPAVEIPQPAPETSQSGLSANQAHPKSTPKENTGNAAVSINESDKAATLVAGFTQVRPEIAETKNHAALVSSADRTANGLRPGSSFIIQLGSFRTINGTMAAFDQHKEKGIDVHWNRVDLGENGIWYRLFTGCFKNKEEAIQFKKDHGLSGAIIVFTPWTVLVAEFASQPEFDKIRLVLRDNQIDYYTLTNIDGSYRFLTGAFVTEEGAEKLAQDIIALGCDAKVVLR